MKTSLKFVLYADPGHGWLKVKREQAIKLLGPRFREITSYSYQRGDSVYLEEDCDFGLLFECAKAKGIEIKYAVKHTNRNSKIRNYECFKP